MSVDILQHIVARRRERLSGSGLGDGPTQGLDLRSGRTKTRTPLPFPAPVICEIKRRSPSRGAFAEELDPVEQARRYRATGARAVSILTEQDHFGGSLEDLVAVRGAFTDLAILRKDFLLNEKDLEVSKAAGADAVLLIAAILTPSKLAQLLAAAAQLGLVALVEVHNGTELETIRALRPPVVGINSRDLRTFRVDLFGPPALAATIDWPATLVFESGIFNREDALLARDAGFHAVLVGEAVMRDPERIPMLTSAMEEPRVRPPRTGSRLPTFWSWCALHTSRTRGATRTSSPGHAESTPHADGTIPLDGISHTDSPPRPLVKICGITNREDALLAWRLGADMLGLVYADSPRSAPPGLARELSAIVEIPLVGVVVEGGEPDTEGTRRAREDLRSGFLAALQLHGRARPEEALEYGWPYYKAVRPASAAEAAALIRESRSVRVLVDAHHRELAGGTGLPVSTEILEAVQEALAQRPQGALWLAGGLAADTIGRVVRRWNPELVDASSRLEAAPGKKDPALMEAFFAALCSSNERNPNDEER